MSNHSPILRHQIKRTRDQSCYCEHGTVMPDEKRPSSPLLPPFGIRELNGPEAAPGVIQITGRQYTSTIRSQPDATLHYVDDDDGEIITVGSSLELQQRLDEPLKRPARPFLPSLCNDNEMMHIFDIQQSAGSLAVWRDHEAYSSKSLRAKSPVKDDTTSLQSPVSPISLEPHITIPPSLPTQPKPQTEVHLDTQPTSSPAVKSTPNNSTKASPSLPAPPAHEQITAQIDQAFGSLCEGIQAQLEPLADFLETAADGLRKAAEKTAESDTTTIENVLAGFKGIWTELGQMSREFLDSIDEQLEKAQAPKPKTPHDAEQPSASPKQAEPSPKLETASKRVSFIDSLSSPAKRLSTGPPPPPSVNNQVTERAFGPSPSFNAWAQKPMFAYPPPRNPPTSKQSVQGESTRSILDWESSDPDFSTRYPPLLSLPLRKAKSVSGIHDKALSQSSARDPLTAVSALSRFPTINQFEEQNRSNTKDEPPTVEQGETASATVSSNSPKPSTYVKPTVEDACHDSPRQSTNTSSVKSQSRPLSAWYPTQLPGSWPEPKASDLQESQKAMLATKTGLAAHSSISPSPDDNMPVKPLSDRLSSPVSETYTRAPIFPRRHQTVSSTNPAARLNGPFDPLANFPSLQPRPQRSQPELKHPHVNTSSRSAFETPDIPGAFPQRSRTVHHTERYKPQPQSGAFNYWRPTLWENYIGNVANQSLPSLSPLPKPGNIRPAFQPPSTSSTLVHQQMFNLPPQRPTQPVAKPQPPTAQKWSRPHLSYSPPPWEKPMQTRTKPEPSVDLSWARPDLSPSPPPSEKPIPPTSRRSSSIVVPLVRPERSEPDLSSYTIRPVRPTVTVPTTRHSNSISSPPTRTPSAITAIEQCVQTLRSMGYGNNANELARLNVYAGAAAGNIEEAIEMIEEDREAAKELDDSKDLERIQSLDV